MTSVLGSEVIRGTYYDGKTSGATTVEVEIGSAAIRIKGLEETRDIPIRSVGVSEPLGRTNRSILLEDGARIDLPDSPELDRIDGGRSAFGFAHALERRWQSVLVVTVLVIGVCWATVTVGVPVAARYLAPVIPAGVSNTISNEGLAQLDRFFFEPSELEPQEQSEILEGFLRVAQYAEGDVPLRLEFRSGEGIGANAFALPSGIVVVTDELVELSEDHEELVAVFAHEAGHVVNRHSMRLLLQSSATAMLVAAFTGDITSLSSLAASIPTVLVQSGYSRTFEREADAYAYEFLEAANIPASRFTDILLRLEAEYGGGVEGVLSYFLTHPPATERVEGGPD